MSTHYALAPYIGTGTHRDPFRPRVAEVPGWSAIDLRHDSWVQHGYALVATPERVRERGVVDLGDEPDRASTSVRRGLRSSLGISLRAHDLRAATLETLTREAWGRRRVKPLLPSRRGWEIWLGGLFLGLPILAGGSLFTDNFNRGDSTNLGGDWVEFLRDWQITANRLTNVDSGSVEIIAHWSADLATVNHYAQATIATDSSLNGLGVLCRKDGSATQTFYYCDHVFSGAQNRTVYKCIGTTYTAIGADVPTTLNTVTNYTAYLEVSGSSLTARLDGGQEINRTDTAITTGQRCGVRSFVGASGSVILTFDNFEMGDLAAPPSGPSTDTRFAVL